LPLIYIIVGLLTIHCPEKNYAQVCQTSIYAAFNQVSPDEKIFTPTDERGFFPYTPHPTPYTLFQVRTGDKNELLDRKRRWDVII
jgi:hypothetical protein